MMLIVVRMHGKWQALCLCMLSDVSRKRKCAPTNEALPVWTDLDVVVGVSPLHCASSVVSVHELSIRALLYLSSRT